MSFQNEIPKSSVIKRTKEIAAILVKYGFRSEVTKLFLGIHLGLKKKKAAPSQLNVSTRLRLAIQDLGPTFIKFGQIMSTRPDLISPELISELKKLTDDVKAVPWETIKPVIEEQCSPIEETFASIEKKPIAAASMSQTYLATLKDGSTVVLKVQRPGIRDQIETDLEILRFISKHAKSTPELELFNLPGAVEEFSRQILAELDFTRDGRNADLLASNMKNVEGVRIPKIYWDYSGQRLLVMEYMEGIRIDKVEQIKEMGVDAEKIALLGLSAYWKQIFDDGFFHGDPHPGNLLVTSQGELVFLDFGLFGVVRPEKRDNLLKLFVGIAEEDIDLVVSSLSSFGLVVEDRLLDSFKDDIYLAIVEYGTKTIEPDVKFMDDVIAVFRKYKLVAPTSVMLMVKVFAMVQDICAKLSPDFVLLKETKPLLLKSFKRRILKEADLRQVGLSLLEKFDNLAEIPKNVDAALKQLSKGSYLLKIPDDDIQKLERIADRTSYRILLGLVVSSILIGMSIVILATQNMLGVVEPIQITLLIYAIAILIIVISVVQLVRSRDKH